MKPPQVVLYTRQGCCLCDRAAALLARHGLQPELVDIDANSELREQFTNCVPVVQIDGKIRFRGRVNEVLLKRLLDHRG
jgi:glutaredoxin